MSDMISHSLAFLFTVEEFSGSLKSFCKSLKVQWEDSVLRPQQVSQNIQHLALSWHSKTESSKKLKAQISLEYVSPPKSRAGLAFLNLLNLCIFICKVFWVVFFGGQHLFVFPCCWFFGFLFFLGKQYYSVISCKSEGLLKLEAGYRRSRIRPLVLRDLSFCAVGCLVS